MKIERVIFIFEKNEDKLVKKIIARNLSLSTIAELFKVKEDDPQFFSPNRIGKNQYDKINNYVPELKNYPFEKFEMYLEAVYMQ